MNRATRWIAQRLPDVGWRWRWRDRVVSRWWAKRLKPHRCPGLVWATDLYAAAGAVKAGLGDRLIFNPPWCVSGMHSVYEAHPQLTTLRCRKGLRRLEALVVRHARWIVGASENVIDQLRTAYGSRDGMHVVPHGVAAVPDEVISPEAARRQLGIGSSERVIGLVCRVEPVKDIGFLLRAMALAGGAVDRLLVVGDGPQREELTSLAGQLGVADRIQWTGRLDDPTPAYRAMDAMVLPSIYEAFGNVVLEAMAAGVPVIGRRRSFDLSRPVLTANEELIADGKSGWLVDPHNPVDLAQTLKFLKQQPVLVEQAGRHAKAQADRFTWDRTIQTYLALLDLGQPGDALPAPSLARPSRDLAA
jgi:glycosyltransferase involved in cell wall biosynthesis